MDTKNSKTTNKHKETHVFFVVLEFRKSAHA